jgi:PilZ domain
MGVAVSVETFLKQRAVNITVNGSYSLQRRWYDADGTLRTFACRTNRVSPFRMLVEVPVVGHVGERMTSYFREFGELEGIITHARRGSFLVQMEMTAARRARLSEQLTWLEKKFKDASVQDAREDARIIPPTSHSVMMLADGSVHGCFIIDISSAGAAVSAEMQLPIGTPLAVGACVGRVIRIFETGFAVKFVERQNIDDLSRLITVQPRQGSTFSAEDSAGGVGGQQSAKCA